MDKNDTVYAHGKYPHSFHQGLCFTVNTGRRTLEQRLVMVQNHMEDIKKQMTYLQNAFDLTQKKLSFYEKLLVSSSYKEMSYSEEWKLFNHGEN